MQSWTILAAKHAALTPGIALGAIPAAGWDSLDGVAIGMLLAGIGFAAVSARRVPSCPLPPAGGQVAMADGGRPPAGRLTKFRRRVDGVLTGMLSDDADKLNLAAAGGRDVRRSAETPEPRFEGPSAWRGDYVDALPSRRVPESHPYPDVPANPPQACEPRDPESPAGATKPAGPAFRVSTVNAAPWPWLTSSATVDGEQLWPLDSKDPGQADHREELERALAAAQVKADVRPLPPPAERRRDAVQRFMAAPVVDLGMVREERAREQGQVNPAGEPGRPVAGRDPKAAERDRAVAERDSRDNVTSRGWPISSDSDPSGPSSVRPIPVSTSPSWVNPGISCAEGSASTSAPSVSARAKTGAAAGPAIKTQPGDPAPGWLAADGQETAGRAETDENFWGPRGAADAAAASVQAGKQRADGRAKDAKPGGDSGKQQADGQGKDAKQGRDGSEPGGDGRKPGDGRRAKPRHAAPPASFGATLSRRLSGTRLTSRSAAHAG
jgi:hypothetical protein